MEEGQLVEEEVEELQRLGTLLVLRLEPETLALVEEKESLMFVEMKCYLLAEDAAAEEAEKSRTDWRQHNRLHLVKFEMVQVFDYRFDLFERAEAALWMLGPFGAVERREELFDLMENYLERHLWPEIHFGRGLGEQEVGSAVVPLYFVDSVPVRLKQRQQIWPYRFEMVAWVLSPPQAGEKKSQLLPLLVWLPLERVQRRNHHLEEDTYYWNNPLTIS